MTVKLRLREEAPLPVRERFAVEALTVRAALDVVHRPLRFGIGGRKHLPDTVEKMQRRIQYDLAYLRNWSLRLDLVIVARTALLLIFGDRKAY